MHDKGTADRKRTVDGIKVVCMLGMGEKKATGWESRLAARSKEAFRWLGLGTRRLVRGTRPCGAATHEQSARCSSHDLGSLESDNCTRKLIGEECTAIGKTLGMLGRQPAPEPRLIL